MAIERADRTDAATSQLLNASDGERHREAIDHAEQHQARRSARGAQWAHGSMDRQRDDRVGWIQRQLSE